MQLFALRGAVDVEHNNAAEILEATTELMKEIMARNGLSPEAVVSCVFTATHDLDAEFPAVAARAVGFDRVPLLCAQEIPVPGAMPPASMTTAQGGLQPSPGAPAPPPAAAYGPPPQPQAPPETRRNAPGNAAAPRAV